MMVGTAGLEPTQAVLQTAALPVKLPPRKLGGGRQPMLLALLVYFLVLYSLAKPPRSQNARYPVATIVVIMAKLGRSGSN